MMIMRDYHMGIENQCGKNQKKKFKTFNYQVHY
jgi:hypothetical protein